MRGGRDPWGVRKGLLSLRTQEETAIYKPKKEASAETKAADTLVSDFQPPRL